MPLLHHEPAQLLARLALSKIPQSHKNSVDFRNVRVAPVRFGSVKVGVWNGSSGSGFRFRRFLCKKGLSVFQYSLT